MRRAPTPKRIAADAEDDEGRSGRDPARVAAVDEVDHAAADVVGTDRQRDAGDQRHVHRTQGAGHAFSIAEWTGVAVIWIYVFAATRAAGLTLVRSLLWSAALTACGIGLVELKLLAHPTA